MTTIEDHKLALERARQALDDAETAATDLQALREQAEAADRDARAQLAAAEVLAGNQATVIEQLHAQIRELEDKLNPKPAHWVGTVWSACPANPGGNDLAAQKRVPTKWGAFGAVVGVRQFMSAAPVTVGPFLAPGVERVHTSWNLDDAAVNSGSLDKDIDAMLLRAAATPYVHLVENRHESDNDGLTGTALTNRIKAKNRIWERKEALGLGDKVLVVATFTGGFWASYGSDATRDLWLSQTKCDVAGLDADGVHTKTGPDYRTSYADEVKNLLRYQAKYGIPHVTVPEFGTSRQPWDTTGQPRAGWVLVQARILATAKPLMVAAYDYNTASNPGGPGKPFNQLTAGSPEFGVWHDDFLALNTA